MTEPDRRVFVRARGGGKRAQNQQRRQGRKGKVKKKESAHIAQWAQGRLGQITKAGHTGGKSAQIYQVHRGGTTVAAFCPVPAVRQQRETKNSSIKDTPTKGI